MMSSKTDDWATPQAFFDECNKEFNFTVDVCATNKNTKCEEFWNKEDDGLIKNWNHLRCWMNPPYGREIGKWVKKASEARGGVVVCLLPARTDTRYFHDYIYKKKGVEIRFIKGRIKFSNKGPAPFPSMLVVFNGTCKRMSK